ncbi:MAG: STAS domain-containing protein [Akkermansia sp.]|nr:STAS domain-containing protein [Akkermansia sp.]
MTDTSLSYYEFEDCLWIRCTSRGSFVNSPALKTVAEKYLARGGKTIVMDMEICPGVDSTFMGTLAGLARKCMAAMGSLQVATPTKRTRDAMENLGLDMLLDMDAADAFWRPDLALRRARMENNGKTAAGNDARALSELDRTRHVLEAHNTLRSMSSRNNEAFGYVCETLEEDLMRQEAALEEQDE